MKHRDEFKARPEKNFIISGLLYYEIVIPAIDKLNRCCMYTELNWHQYKFELIFILIKRNNEI